MNLDRGRLLGYVLVAAGALALLGSIPLFRQLPALIWLLVLFGIGAVVWSASSIRLPFWLRLVLYVIIGIYATASTGSFGGAAATGFIAIAFMLTYVLQPRRWRAPIPGGVSNGRSLL